MMIVLFIAIGVIVLFLSSRNYTYWIFRNVKCDPPIPLFGNYYKVLIGMKTDIEDVSDLYKKYESEKVVGYYRGTTPELIIRDPDIIKNILNVDFSHFHARGVGRDPKYEPLMFNVFSSDGDRWKLLRHGLSPAFTSNKLRNMFPLILQCTDKLQAVAKILANKGEKISALDLMSRFTIEFIGACGFGLEMNTINTENSLFIRLREIIFTKSKKQMLLFALRVLFPGVKIINKIPIANEEVETTILEIMKCIRDQRNNKPSDRNDFVDLLLELEENKILRGDSLDIKDENGLPKKVELEITPMISASQLFIFFAAGFETSATAMSCTLHQLAFHPEIQIKVHEEIDTVLSKYDNKICYEAIMEMSYLEMVFKESMRIFPPGGVTFRVCIKNYSIPELGLTIEAGTKIIIPIQALHMDPKYYDNPSEFKPDRFSPESVKTRHRYVYLPFGEGPRKCIGARLGIIESLTGLVGLLQKFTVEPAPSSKKDIKSKKTAYLVQVNDDGVPVKLIPRKTQNA